MAEKDNSIHPLFMGRRYFSLVIVLVFVILSATAFYICYRHHRINTDEALKDDRSTANLLSLLLDEHLKKIVSVMESYTNRPLLLQAVRDKNAEKAETDLISLTKSDPDIDILIILDRDGTLWANYPKRPEVLGKNFAYRDYYKGVSEEWKPYISDVFLRIVGDKDLAVTICVPFFDEKGDAIGILVNTQRTVGLSKLFKLVPPDPGTSISITDRKDQIIYSSRYDYQREIRSYPFQSGMKKAMAAKNNTVAVDDPNVGGGTSYISFSSAGSIGWSVFVERDQRSILLSESAYYIQVTAIAFLLFLSIVLFLAYSRRQVTTQQTREKLRTEKEVQTSETRFRELFDNMSNGVAIYKAIDDGDDFIILDLNEAGKKITHVYTDFIGKRVCDVFPGVKPLGLFEIFQQVWKTGKAEFYPSSQYEDDRLTFWAENYVYKLPSDEIVAVFDDITDRKRTEDALRNASERLSLAVQAGGVGIWEFDVVNNNLIWDDQMFHLYGITPDRFGGTYEAWRAGVHPEDLRQGEVELQMALRGEKEFDTEFRVVWPDGTIRNIHARALVQRDASGQPTNLIGTNNDITERKRTEEEIKKLNAELEQRVMDRTAQLEATNRELEAFSYSVSHDLRAPLRSIDGFSQALLEEYQEKLDDTGKGYLERVRRATQRMGLLIDDLLKLSRVIRSDIQREPVDLSKMVRAIAETNQQNHPDRAVDAIIQEGIVVQGDPHLIQIVLMNLMDNAWKFTVNARHPRIEFGRTIQEGKTAYYVRDNGAGFDMAYVNKLFGAFQRLHTKEEFAGMGIGLATVQRIIARHGGRVWAEGEVGKGATFYFTLPF